MRRKAQGIVAVLFVFAAALAAVARPEKEPEIHKTLPTFDKGKWINCYIAYSHANFDATIDSKGVLMIKPKDRGKYVGKPFTCYQLSCYYVPPREHHKGRPPVEFHNPGKPRDLTTDRDKTVTIKGLLKDGVPFELFYEFRNNEITAAGGCADPKGLSFPTVFRISSYMRPSHSIPPSMEQEDREKLLKTCIVKTRERVAGRKKTYKYPYYDIMKPHGSLEFVEVKGPYGPRVIQMKPIHQEGILRCYIYSNYCPWQGYSIYYNTQSDKINLKKNRVKMIIK